VVLDHDSVPPRHASYGWHPIHYWLGNGNVEGAYLEMVALDDDDDDADDDSADRDNAVAGHGDNSPAMVRAHLDRLELP